MLKDNYGFMQSAVLVCAVILGKVLESQYLTFCSVACKQCMTMDSPSHGAAMASSTGWCVCSS